MPRKKPPSESPPRARKLAAKRTRVSGFVSEKLPRISDEVAGPFVGYEDELGIDDPETNDDDEAATIET